jgi:hypothetical protein
MADQYIPKAFGVDIIRNFGPTIVKTELPQEMIDDLNQDCSDILDSKKEKKDWSDDLAGRVEEEFLISQDVLSKYNTYIAAVASRLLFPTEEEFNLNKDKFQAGVNSGWYVRQYESDYNPRHWHTGCQISCVGYLKLPEDYEETQKIESQDHNPAMGYITFHYGSMLLTNINNMKFEPKVGDFYMFPSWLEHSVNPFRSKYKAPDPKGERRSFSMNVIFRNT